MKMTRKRKWALAAVLGVLLAVPAAMVAARSGFEHAHYDVVESRDAFEIRRYAPRVVAEVTVIAQDGKAATSKGFRVLADYIFGNNIASDKVAMTTPVDRQQRASQKIAMTTPVDRSGQDGSWTVRFTMPSEYSLSELPRPNDARVQLREVAAASFAAVRFRGQLDERQVTERMAELQRAVVAAGLQAAADREPVFAQYDPPWTPNFLRRNEVMVELAPSS